ncbi:unnamed protein product [Meloidogyne enterolobii]|uniref:Uncharacterized protein n=1 Tax=Meloidogyne enterolobii TaxID=390850 RepID=A0ACB1B885_MELEN
MSDALFIALTERKLHTPDIGVCFFFIFSMGLNFRGPFQLYFLNNPQIFFLSASLFFLFSENILKNLFILYL